MLGWDIVIATGIGLVTAGIAIAAFITANEANDIASRALQAQELRRPDTELPFPAFPTEGMDSGRSRNLNAPDGATDTIPAHCGPRSCDSMFSLVC